MPQKNELSPSGILVIGIIITAVCSIIFYASSLIVKRFTPSVQNAEHYLKVGKLDEATAIAVKIRDERIKELLRGKIFLATSLRQQKENHWKTYGIDSTDWLKSALSDSALSCFKRVIALDSASVKARYFMGILYKEKGWFREAEEVLQIAMGFDSSNRDVRLALGVLYTDIHHYDEAEQQFKQVIHLDKENAQAAKNLGYLYRFHLERPESAMVWLHNYLQWARPGDIDLNQASIEFEELQKRYPEFITPEMKKRSRKIRVFIPHFRSSR